MDKKTRQYQKELEYKVLKLSGYNPNEIVWIKDDKLYLMNIKNIYFGDEPTWWLPPDTTNKIILPTYQEKEINEWVDSLPDDIPIVKYWKKQGFGYEWIDKFIEKLEE